jgi:hypothetical protein
VAIAAVRRNIGTASIEGVIAAGGIYNVASGNRSSVFGGNGKTADGDRQTVVGNLKNHQDHDHQESRRTVVGGSS